MQIIFVEVDLLQIEKSLCNLSPAQGLKWFDLRFGSKVKLSNGLGAEGQLLTYWVSIHKLKTEIFTIDTGRLFQESYDLLEQTNKHLTSNIKVYYPEAKEVTSMVSEKGPNSFYHSVTNRMECCEIRKIHPLKKALSDASVWVTGVRAEQSAFRQGIKLVEWNKTHNLIKYNPLVYWDAESVSELISEYNIPTNTLHKRGFKSIGCLPCTRAVESDEDERAGRWWWENGVKECGLHLQPTNY